MNYETSHKFFNKPAFLAYPGKTFIDNQNIFMNTLYKNVLHDNGHNLALFKNSKPNVFAQTRQSAKIYDFDYHDFTQKDFLHGHL